MNVGRTILLAASILPLLLAGCEAEPPTKADPGAAPQKVEGQPKEVPIGPNVLLEVAGKRRRVLVGARVCLREGMLEQFVTRKNAKEHEAVLAADVDARDVHKALILAGAEPGNPVRYDPQFVPPRGSLVRVLVRYQDSKGETITRNGREWIRNLKTMKELATDWVFAGSRLVQFPEAKDKPPFYAANSGDLICVSNFPEAMLDLPINSPKDNEDLAFEAWIERIPPLETKVTLILEPVPAKPNSP